MARSSNSSTASEEKKKQEVFKKDETTGEFSDNQFWKTPSWDFDLDELMADMNWNKCWLCLQQMCEEQRSAQFHPMYATPWASLRTMSCPWLCLSATAKPSNLAVLWALNNLPLRMGKFALCNYPIHSEVVVFSVPIVPFHLFCFKIDINQAHTLSSVF